MRVRETATGLCYESDFMPHDCVPISEKEYQDYVNPPVAVLRAKLMADPTKTTTEKKKYLFESLRHQLKTDGSCEEDPNLPFFDPPMTIDELQIEYSKYVGDDDERASSILNAKGAAKAYIRSLFEGC